ncbi:pilin [Patescibacteria group bacterium]|nr:pilin [Patescibacteria group bacterium]
MIKRIIILVIIVAFFGSIDAFAKEVRPGDPCTPGDTCCNKTSGACIDDGLFACQFIQNDNVGKPTYQCKESQFGKSFGKIQAPAPLAGFLQKDPTGAGAISNFLSNAIILIYSLAAIVLIFMLLWGAFEWLTSGGDKEKISSAQKRIINAIIGILLFAIAFAIIAVLGQFTGFKFFEGQNAAQRTLSAPKMK